jgi:hypothetical protein
MPPAQMTVGGSVLYTDRKIILHSTVALSPGTKVDLCTNNRQIRRTGFESVRLDSTTATVLPSGGTAGMIYFGYL